MHTYVDGHPVTRPPTDAERDAVKAALFPHGPPPRVARPRKGRFSNSRFGYDVDFPAEFAVIPRFADGDWEDGIFIPLPGGTTYGSLVQLRGWGIGVVANENVWIMEDPRKPPRPRPVYEGEVKSRSKVRTKLAGLPGWRVVTRTSRAGIELVEDTIRVFRRFEPNQPGESGDACRVHYFRYELSLQCPATTYDGDRKLFEKVLSSFRLAPLP